MLVRSLFYSSVLAVMSLTTEKGTVASAISFLLVFKLTENLLM